MVLIVWGGAVPEHGASTVARRSLRPTRNQCSPNSRPITRAGTEVRNATVIGSDLLKVSYDRGVRL